MSDQLAATRRLIRLCGTALVAGGLLAALVNAILTPLLPTGTGGAAVAGSLAFGIRMPLAAASVAMTTFGVVGLYLALAHRLRWGSLAFLVAGVGGLLAFCAECVQFTLVRDLAFEVPEVLDRLQGADQLARYDLGFAIAVSLFALGWLAVGFVTLRAGVLPKRGPLTLLAGLFLLPLLGGLAGIWGAVAGNMVLGAGWVLLGVDLSRSAESGKP